MPPFVHHSFPFAEPEEPPPPIVVLLLHTDLDAPVSPALLIHHDLGGFAASATKKVVLFAPPPETTSDHTYPPAPTIPFPIILDDPKIPRPTAITRKSIALHVDSLAWGKQKTSQIKKCLHALADQLLDKRLSYTHQNTERVEQVLRMAAEMFPELDNYEGRWPATCILMARLKSTAAASKKANETQAIVDAVSEAVASRTRGRSKVINQISSGDVG